MLGEMQVKRPLPVAVRWWFWWMSTVMVNWVRRLPLRVVWGVVSWRVSSVGWWGVVGVGWGWVVMLSSHRRKWWSRGTLNWVWAR
ncbi:hypothetical protein SAM40697_6723 [Streptomyces ambofaciens]|uniref:Integral membrane protein n=1 Tax=Streptomyces ambofaciens TaxID=1889 RepID=A0ABM6B9Z0_STRAM|nr:hypothetical protein SAM40697_6723 [Streptomyces ambofaciens]